MCKKGRRKRTRNNVLMLSEKIDVAVKEYFDEELSKGKERHRI